MAVQQNKKSTARRGNHRSHAALTNPAVAVEATTGEVHLRHHILPRQEGHQDQERRRVILRSSLRKVAARVRPGGDFFRIDVSLLPEDCGQSAPMRHCALLR